MSNATVRLTVALAAILLVSGAQAASFNCAKAKTLDEKAICANSSLSDLDLKMATLFGVRMKLPMLMGARGAAQDEQRDFLTVRGSCGTDAVCIGTAYQQRIDAINAEIDAAMQDYCVKLGICG
jgi:uncharacterized protein